MLQQANHVRHSSVLPCCSSCTNLEIPLSSTRAILRPTGAPLITGMPLDRTSKSAFVRGRYDEGINSTPSNLYACNPLYDAGGRMNPADFIERFATSVGQHPAVALLVAFAGGILSTST
jgi:hypothetical protein